MQYKVTLEVGKQKIEFTVDANDKEQAKVMIQKLMEFAIKEKITVTQ